MAFWCSEQIVVTLEGPDGKSEIVLPQPFARIGSHPQSDIVLAEPLAPRRALYLHATPEGLYCVDLDVPEASQEAHDRWLPPDEVVPIGPYRLSARLASGGSDVLPAHRLAERGSAPNPLPVINIYCGSLLKDRRRLRARLSLVGRRPQCAVRLRGYQVSSYHCVLYWHERRLWCIDLNASNVTLLNDQPIGCHEVQRSDRLEVGEFRLVYYRWSPRNWREGVERHDTWVAPAEEENRPVSPGGDFDAPPGAATIFLPAGTPMPAGGWHQAAPVALPPPVVPIPDPHAEALAAGRAAEAHLSAEVERLSQERAELQARWEQSSRELSQRIDQLEKQASRLAAQGETLSKARDQLQAERDALGRQLEERSRQFEELKSELATLQSASAAAQQERDEARREHQQLVQQFEQQLRAAEAESRAMQQSQAERDRQAADIERLSQERAEAEARWQHSSQRLAARVQELEAQSSKMAAEHAALRQASDQWQAERTAMTRQLAERERQLDQLRAELTQATARFAQQEQHAFDQPQAFGLAAEESPAVEPVHMVAASSGEPQWLPFDQTSSATGDSLDLPAMEASKPFDLEADVATGQEPNGTVPDFAGRGAAGPPGAASEMPAIVTHPSDHNGRRTKSHDELGSFVSDRLVELQDRKRRRKILMWSGAVLAAVGASAVGILLAWQMLN